MSRLSPLKTALASALLVAGFAAAVSFASAGPSGAAPAVAAVDPATNCTYPLYRYFGGGDHREVPWFDAIAGKGLAFEGTLGGVCRPGPSGLVTVHVCSTTEGARYVDFFLSPDAGCEGRAHVTEFALWPGPVPGTHPIYRCIAADHYTSVDPGCEGAGRQEGLLGYVNDRHF